MGGGEPGRLKRLSLTCWSSPGEDGLALRGAHGYLELCQGRPGAEEGTALLSEITELRRRLGAKQVQNWKSTASVGKDLAGSGSGHGHDKKDNRGCREVRAARNPQHWRPG